MPSTNIDIIQFYFKKCWLENVNAAVLSSAQLCLYNVTTHTACSGTSTSYSGERKKPMQCIPLSSFLFYPSILFHSFPLTLSAHLDLLFAPPPPPPLPVLACGWLCLGTIAPQLPGPPAGPLLTQSILILTAGPRGGGGG